jgi:uncharacterized membrane protein YfcA
VSLLWVVAGVGVLLGAALQSAVGFGFALVAAPLLFAATDPEQAVGLSIVLALWVNVMTIGTERRAPVPLWRTVAVLCLWALPGMVAGVLVLQAVSSTALQVLLTVAVFVALFVQRNAGVALPAWAAPLAGTSSGVLATTTTTSGPPLVLLLRGRGHAPAAIRDTLTTLFLAYTVLSAVVLLAFGVDRAVPELVPLLALTPLVVVGHLAGRPVFARLARGHYEDVLTAVLVASAVTGLATVLL